MCALPIAAATLLGSAHVADAQSTEPQWFYVQASLDRGHLRGSSPSDQVLTFSVPVQVPRVILPAGTYIFRPMSSGVVQVLAANGSHVTIFMAIPATKADVKHAGEALFLRVRDDVPIKLMAWYPEIGTGFQPIYPKSDKLSVYGAPKAAER
jgi:hypothetical protein